MGQGVCDNGPSKTQRGVLNMRGYFTAGGYYGLVGGKYILFSAESDYYDYFNNEDREGD